MWRATSKLNDTLVLAVALSLSDSDLLQDKRAAAAAAIDASSYLGANLRKGSDQVCCAEIRRTINVFEYLLMAKYQFAYGVDAICRRPVTRTVASRI